jgi:hypothetical protein
LSLAAPLDAVEKLAGNTGAPAIKFHLGRESILSILMVAFAVQHVWRVRPGPRVSGHGELTVGHRVRHGKLGLGLGESDKCLFDTLDGVLANLLDPCARIGRDSDANGSSLDACEVKRKGAHALDDVAHGNLFLNRAIVGKDLLAGQG